MTDCSSRVFLSVASRQHIDEVLACSMATEGKGKQANLAMNMVAGNLYSIYKKRVDVTKDQKLIAKVAVEIATSDNLEERKKNDKEDYHVANLQNEDVPMTESNLLLLPNSGSLDDLESRVRSTSVSTGPTSSKQKPGASLTVVLKQALQSDDVEQLDWIVAQRDAVLVEATL